MLLILLVAACSGGGEADEGGASAHPDGDWQLTSGMDLVDDFPITMSINGVEVSGRAACNSYFGTVQGDGTAISFGEMGWTEMGCEPDVMRAETTFLTMLGLVESFDYAEGGLVLVGPQGDLVFDKVEPIPTAELIETTWVLETIVEGETAASVGGEPATLLFAADGTLTGSTGCRTLTGRWVDNGAVIAVPELSADGECSRDLVRQDGLAVTVVGDEFRASIDGDRLTLTSMGGDGLVYRAER